MIINTKAIEELLNGETSAYEIEKQTGVSRVTINEIRKGGRKMENVPLKNLEKLQTYINNKEEMDMWDKVVDYEAVDGIMYFELEDGTTLEGDASNETVEEWIKENTNLIPSDYDEWSEEDKAEALSGWYQLKEDEIDFHIFKEAIKNA